MEFSLKDIATRANIEESLVEDFLAILKERDISGVFQCSPDASLTALKRAVQLSTDTSLSWILCVERALQEVFGEELIPKHTWMPSAQLAQLKTLIKHNQVTISRFSTDSAFAIHEETFFDIIVPNLISLGRVNPSFPNMIKGNANPASLTIVKGEDFLYYIFESINTLIPNTNVTFVYYSDGTHFNIMKSKLVAMGNSDSGTIQEIWKLIMEHNAS